MVPMFCPPLMTSPTPSPSQAATSSTHATPKPTVFVAGATGNVGRRLVRKLAQAGCRVRAASRNAAKCRDRVGELADLDDLVEYIPFDVVETTKFPIAIGPSEVIVSAMGAPFSFGRVDGLGIADLMTAAAKMEGVRQLIVVSSIGVGRPWAFPAALLNLFGGVLFFKDRSERVTRKVAREEGKKYLIVRPGGMERPTDDFGKTHNLRLAKRNALSGGLVSNLQIAELIVAAVLNPEVADGKTVEAVAETDAPKVDFKTLLEKATAD